MTFLAALRHDRARGRPGSSTARSTARRFRTLRRAGPGADTPPRRHRRHGQPRSHKSAAVRRAIRGAGARLFLLPKYSPDLNPIEKLFAKLKHWLRKAAARTPDAVCDAIRHILDTVTASECTNYFIEAGYAPA